MPAVYIIGAGAVLSLANPVLPSGILSGRLRAVCRFSIAAVTRTAALWRSDPWRRFFRFHVLFLHNGPRLAVGRGADRLCWPGRRLGSFVPDAANWASPVVGNRYPREQRGGGV